MEVLELLELFEGLPAPVWKRLAQTPEYAAFQAVNKVADAHFIEDCTSRLRKRGTSGAGDAPEATCLRAGVRPALRAKKTLRHKAFRSHRASPRGPSLAAMRQFTLSRCSRLEVKGCGP